MNKNISFFIALSIFNFTYTQEAINDSQVETITLEQNKTLTRNHNLTIRIQAKDLNDTALFDQKSQELLDIIQTVHRSQNGAHLYSQILNFIKELQEAIVAGYNLFTTATTSNSAQIISVIKEAMSTESTSAVQEETAVESEATSKASEVVREENEADNVVSQENNEAVVVEETVAQEETASSQVVTTTEENVVAPEVTETLAETKAESLDSKHIEINLNVFLEKSEDEELFNAICAKMDALAEILNNNSSSAQDVTNLFNDLILAAHHLQNTNLTIKIN